MKPFIKIRRNGTRNPTGLLEYMAAERDRYYPRHPSGLLDFAIETIQLMDIDTGKLMRKLKTTNNIPKSFILKGRKFHGKR